MTKFAEHIIINVPNDVVFIYTQDYSKRLEWDTFLSRAELIGGATEAAKGVRAYCRARMGLGMETEYVTFTPATVTAIRMTKGPFFFKQFLGSWRFKQLATQQTEVVFLYSFELRFPFDLFTRIVKRNLQRNVRMRLRDLKSSIESRTDISQ